MENGVERWIVDISEWNPSPSHFSSLISLLPQHHHSITRFVRMEDQKRALVSKLLQYGLVHQVLGIPFDDIIIRSTLEGKPYVQFDKMRPEFPNFNFSVSHHGDFVAIASEPFCLVGLDIVSHASPPKETARQFINSFSSYFSSTEWNNIINAGSCDDMLQTLYRPDALEFNQVKTSCEVSSISTSDQGCTLSFGDGSQCTYDRCIIALHAPDAIRILEEKATHDERRILGAFQYVNCDVFLHHDTSLMPQNPAAWSSWNFLGSNNSKVCITYWLNLLQGIKGTCVPYLETLNPPYQPQNVLLKWSTSHPVPSVAATKASLELRNIQGTRGIWFCGAYQGYGFHEDGIKAGKIAAHGLLGEKFSILPYPKQMVPSLAEGAARLCVTRFLSRFISAGKLILLEDGGSVLTFEGSRDICPLTVAIRVHNPQFYWKVATEADLGFADAYIQGDISFVDKDDGILHIIMIFIYNKYLLPSASRVNHRDWWTSLFSFTTSVASMRFVYHQICRRNTITQARRNISDHYDLSNNMFSLFLDETMTYSSAIFKSENEDLKVAQMRKISLLIDKARVEKSHEVLEIGCGWGSIAVEVVKRTGCSYTGITISEEQLKYAEARVKKAGLEDRIRFLLCDYRQLKDVHKYDRIISCEMLEAVGHEYMEDFFRCCDSLLATDGLLILQSVSVPDICYDEFRKCPGFIKEYIFPGGCLPSLSRITSAMAAASTLCVEHLENIGVHYGQTLRCWRKIFLQNKSKILALGFNEKFIRMWEYYFDYCAAGFNMRLLGDYQVVFSRQVNLTAFSDPYASIPSTHCFP